MHLRAAEKLWVNKWNRVGEIKKILVVQEITMSLLKVHFRSMDIF